MADHGASTGIIGRECELPAAELREPHQQISCRAIEVLGHVMGVDAKAAGRVGHQLPQPDGPGM